MRQRHLVQRALPAALSISALALFVATAVPHHHETASVSHQTQPCRACKIQEGFTATPPAAAVTSVQPDLVGRSSLPVLQAPDVRFVNRAVSPRAPPVRS